MGSARTTQRAAADGAEQAADLGQRSGAEPEEDGEDDQQDGDEVERVHRPIVAQVAEWCLNAPDAVAGAFGGARAGAEGRRVSRP